MPNNSYSSPQKIDHRAAGHASLRPSRLWYFLALGIWIVTASAFAHLASEAMDRLDRDFVRFAAPGSVSVQISEPGNYIVYREQADTFTNRIHQFIKGDSLRLEVVQSGTRQLQVAIGVPHRTHGSSEGPLYSAYVVELKAPGLYRLTGSYRGGASQPKMFLALARNPLDRVAKFSTQAGFLVFSGLAASISVGVFIFVRRRRHHLRLGANSVAVSA